MSNPADGAAGMVSTAPLEGSLNGFVAPREPDGRPGRNNRGWDAPPARPRILTANLVLLCVLLLVAGGVVGYLLSGLISKTYAARFQVAVPTTATDDALVGRQVENQVQVLTGRDLLGPVASRAGIPVDTLVKRVQATAVPGSSVVTVTVKAQNRTRALAMAQDMSSRYLHNPATGPNQQAISYLRSLIDGLTGQQAALAQQRAATAGSPGAVASIDARSATLATQINSLQSQVATLTTQSLASGAVSLLTAPYELTDPVSPKPVQAAALGAIAGAVIAGAVVGILALLRRPQGAHA